MVYFAENAGKAAGSGVKKYAIGATFCTSKLPLSQKCSLPIRDRQAA